MQTLQFKTKNLLVGLLILILLSSKTSALEITTIPPANSETLQKELLVSAVVAEFDSSLLNPWIDEITHLRTYGIDFEKPKTVDGLYQYVDDDKMNDYIAFCKSKNLKVVWTLNVSSFTLEQEISYVKDLIARGLNIVAFEYGGEFYLKKYYIGDANTKKVVEKIRMDGENRDYLDLLDMWLPAVTKKFPIGEYEHIIVTASVTSEQNNATEYRKAFNDKVFEYVENNPELKGKVSFSYHLYAGNKPNKYNKDEEIVYPDKIDWSFLNEKPADSRWVVTESGYYISDFSQKQLNLVKNFYEEQSKHLSENDLMGIHPLLTQTKKEHPLALYTLNGMTPVGSTIQSWSQERTINSHKCWWKRGVFWNWLNKRISDIK